jgi:uncharacterized membrane protein YjjP (DUF1212 family)
MVGASKQVVSAPLEASALAFLLRFTEVGHRAGYPTVDLEERLLSLARTFGIEGAQISSTPTLVELSVGPLAGQRSFSLRVRPRPGDLDAITRLDDVVHDVLEGRVDAVAATAELDEIEADPLERPWPIRLGAYALAGAALTPVLGGGWRELAAGAFVGLLVGIVALASTRVEGSEFMLAPLAAVVASFSAATITHLGLHASPDVVTLAALVTFLPGMALTIGMRELASEHLQSGVSNTANALVGLLGLVFGVGVGRSIATSWFGAEKAFTPNTTFSGIHIFAAIFAGVAFTVTLRAQTRAVPIMCVATVLAITSSAAGRALLGPAAGVFVAALAIGVTGGLLGIKRRRSPLVFIVPGVLILVPGSAGFDSVLKLLTGQTVSGVDAGFDTFVTAMSIAYGLMLSTIVLPRRFTHFGETAHA